MVTNDDKNLNNNSELLIKDISKLRIELDKISIQKEGWFEKKEKLKKEVLELIQKVKGLRVKKIESDKIVRLLKKERDNYNREVQNHVSKIKSTRIDRSKEQNPNFLKKKIEELEEKIETEVLSLSKEKTLMKEINKMKKEYSVISGSLKENFELSENIKQAKLKAEESHKKVQNAAMQGQKIYEELTLLSKKIKDLNKIQEGAFDKFLKYKTEFGLKTKYLEKNLKKIGESKRKFKKTQDKKTQDKKLRNENLIKNKVKNAEEKLKKGKKLTKDDLMAFQKE